MIMLIILKEYSKNLDKWKFCIEWCNNRGYKFIIITEKTFEAKKVPEGFNYDSGSNSEWETVESLRSLIKEHVDSNFN